METKEEEEEEMMIKSQVQERFSDFYEQWLLQQESNLKQLLIAQRDHHDHHHPKVPYDLESSSSSSDGVYRALISKLMNNYKEYYATKWVRAHEDILGFFSPPWFTPLEKAYLWMTDWKPSMLYRLIHSLSQPRVPPNTTIIRESLISITDDQLKKIEELRLRTGLEEEKVEREMERQQVSMADRKMVELARLSGRRVTNGEINNNNIVGDDQVDGLVEVALKSLLDGLEKIVKTADCVRLKALKGVLEVLTPLQSVDFMAAFLVLQFQLRRLGKRRFQ